MNTLYYGDNLNILRDKIQDNSIDLIYLDPPFNSKADYNILFKEPTGRPSKAQITAFEDTWHWTDETEYIFDEIIRTASAGVKAMMISFRRFVNANDMMAYLTMMCIRMIELERVLKDSGSIYLHCDPTASHYLKILMDTIFSKKHFRNEIIWHYRKWPSGFKQFQRNHDCILFYSKTDSEKRIFNQVDLMERAESTLKRFGTKKIISGHDSDGRRLPSKTSEEDSMGVNRDDVWDINRVPPIKQLFPTQKPDALLSRIIKASSNKDDVILDPFCGCGTATVVAEMLNRRWIGIDITHLAINLIKWRLRNMFGLIPKKDYVVIGEPIDLPGAKELASYNRHQFQWWASSLIEGAKPYKGKKKGPDTGIDANLYFKDSPTSHREIIVQVKSGKVSIRDIRELNGVMSRQDAAIGIFVTLEQPTRQMVTEASKFGLYAHDISGAKYPKIQILTIEELLSDKKPSIPITELAYKKADRHYGQLSLDDE
jgi:site-specific DNA-methyltransferase (adenine-specific)